jgi:PAS domain S-box-containing protein
MAAKPQSACGLLPEPPARLAVRPAVPGVPRDWSGRRWLPPLAGLALLHLAHLLTWPARGEPLWFAPAGVALVLVAWLGPRALLLIAADAVLSAVQARFLGWPGGTAPGWPGLGGALGEAGLSAAEAWTAWWCYHRLARGARGLGDPHSAIVFLLLVPGLVAALFAPLHGLNLWLLGLLHESPAYAAGLCWVNRALGLTTLAPPLLAVLTPVLVRHGLVRREPRADAATRDAVPARLTRGDWVEVGGLAAAAAGFGTLVVLVNGGTALAAWQVWAVPLLLIVWAALRQGLPGGTFVAAAAVLLPLTAVSWLVPGQVPFGFQGNLLTEGSLALLVAASMNWVRAGEARYRRVVGHIPVVLYSARLYPPAPRPRGAALSPPDAELTFVSPGARDLLGCAPDALLGPYEHWLARVDPRDREVVVAAVAQLGRQSQPVTCEYRLLPREEDGRGLPPNREWWVRDTLAPRPGPDGRLDGWEGVLLDISEQRALAGTLRRTSSMFHALVSNLPAGVFFVQAPAGAPILVNARARQLLGQRDDGPVDLARLTEVYDLRRPDGTPYPVEELPVYQALRHGLPATRDDIVVHRADRRKVPLITWAAPIHFGGPGEHDAAVWVLEDLSALRQSEERYRALVESLPLGVVQLDRDLQVQYVNPAMQSLTGYALVELRAAAAWQAFVSPGDLPQLTAAFTASLAGRSERLEVRYRAKDGADRVAYVLSQPRRQGGEVHGLTCLVLDVTRERQLEQTLHRSQRGELVARLAGGVLHDFNNLLTVMLSLTELARDRLPAGHAARPDLERVTEAGEQAAALARQLLSFGKQSDPGARAVDLNRLAGKTLGLLRRTLPENIEVRGELGDRALPVRGDETQLQQVLLNLCLNARDAMPAGGRLMVRAAADGEPGWARLTVRDTGAGMDEAVRRRVFDPFFSTKERGSGLGLAVVQQIVTDHGGRIAVESTLGQGACFDVWLPLKEND